MKLLKRLDDWIADKFPVFIGDNLIVFYDPPWRGTNNAVGKPWVEGEEETVNN